MNFAANATRVAIEDICPQIIRLVSECTGARGLMQPFRFGAILKDLSMFLRQPNPDDCLLESGRYLQDHEDAKYADTLNSLTRPRYRDALEIGCSIGVLTRRLAGRCQNLLGIGVSEKAINLAQKRCIDLPHVTFRQMQIPAARLHSYTWPCGSQIPPGFTKRGSLMGLKLRADLLNGIGAGPTS